MRHEERFTVRRKLRTAKQQSAFARQDRIKLRTSQMIDKELIRIQNSPEAVEEFEEDFLSTAYAAG